jgi:hypothetical protein
VRALVLALLLAALPAHAQMYKCVNEKGVTQYTDKPCPAGKGVEIRSKPASPGKPPASIGGKKPPQAKDNSQEAQRKRCELMRLDQVRLSTGDPITIRKPTGERVPMDDAARKKRLAEIQKELRKCK